MEQAFRKSFRVLSLKAHLKLLQSSASGWQRFERLKNQDAARKQGTEQFEKLRYFVEVPLCHREAGSLAAQPVLIQPTVTVFDPAGDTATVQDVPPSIAGRPRGVVEQLNSRV